MWPNPQQIDQNHWRVPDFSGAHILPCERENSIDL